MNSSILAASQAQHAVPEAESVEKAAPDIDALVEKIRGMTGTTKADGAAPASGTSSIDSNLLSANARSQSATPGIPYNVCSGTPVPIGKLVEVLRAKARVPITIAQDPSRFRPNDTPLVLGDHARLTRDTGWSPEIPIEQTVDDLLAYWRQQIAS